MTKMKTDALLSALGANASTTEKKGAGKKKGKPNLDLTPDEVKAFDAFCAADVIYKMAEGKQGSAKAIILPVLRRKLLEKWLEEGRKTDNPTIQTASARANFIVREAIKIDIPENPDGTPGSVKDRLTELFGDKEGTEIFEREFTEKTDVGFKSLTKLRNGDPNEQKAVNKLLKLVIENFSADEQRMILTRETKVEVNNGFLDRAVQHCEGSVEKLDALLCVVSPQWVLSHMTYQGKDLGAAVAELTGGELPTMEVPVKTEEFYSADNHWKAVAKGDEASLYKVNGTDEVFLSTKKCSGADHARNSCKKWMRDPDARAISMAEFTAKK